MPVLTICNHKGGTGKTTSTIHVAVALARRGHRVLAVDLDPQGFLTRLLGLDEPAPEASSLALLADDADVRRLPTAHVSGVDVLGASQALTQALRRYTQPTDVLWLRETLAQGTDHDVVILDTAAALSVYTMNALVASDLVVIPVTPEYQPVVGAEQSWQTCGLVQRKLNPAMATPRFLLTQVDGRYARHTRYTEYLREKYGEAVLPTPIRTSSSLAGSVRDGVTVFDAQPQPRGALDYTAATEEIAAALGLPTPEAPMPVSNGASIPPAAGSETPAAGHDAAPPVAAWTPLNRL